MPDVNALAAQFRRDLLSHERAAATDLVRAYGGAWLRLKRDIERLGNLIRDAEARQLIPALGSDMEALSLREGRRREEWLKEQAEYKILLRQIENEIGQFARYADPVIVQQQARAVAAAESHAEQLTLAGMGPPPAEEPLAQAAVQWRRAPVEATQNLIGVMGDGTPLGKVLNSLAPQATDTMRETLLTGMLKGTNPRQIAQMLRRVAGGQLVRALRISRTETLRAYRGASLESYRANEDVVDKWRWSAAHSARTCAVCLAMDGKEFPLTTEFGSHVQCRCSPVPVTKSWRDLGFDVEETAEKERETGAEWFAKQDAGTQAEVLSKGKLAAYRDGKIELNDLVAYRKDPEWGPTRWEKSLRQAIG